MVVQKQEKNFLLFSLPFVSISYYILIFIICIFILFHFQCIRHIWRKWNWHREIIANTDSARGKKRQDLPSETQELRSAARSTLPRWSLCFTTYRRGEGAPTERGELRTGGRVTPAGSGIHYSCRAAPRWGQFRDDRRLFAREQ